MQTNKNVFFIELLPNSNPLSKSIYLQLMKPACATFPAVCNLILVKTTIKHCEPVLNPNKSFLNQVIPSEFWERVFEEALNLK